MIKLAIDLKHHIKKNLLFYILTCAAFLLGIVVGCINYVVLSGDEASYLQEYMGSFFMSVNGGLPNLASVFWNVLLENGKLVLLMWLFGFSLIGIPFALFVIGTRGFIYGFAISAFMGMYGIKGALIACCALLPQLLIYAPALLSLGVNVIDSSIFFSVGRKGGTKQYFIRYLILTLIFLGVFIFAAAVESYVSPVLIKWASNLVV
jgi:stage II sporulation protein M